MCLRSSNTILKHPTKFSARKRLFRNFSKQTCAVCVLVYLFHWVSVSSVEFKAWKIEKVMKPLSERFFILLQPLQVIKNTREVPRRVKNPFNSSSSSLAKLNYCWRLCKTLSIGLNSLIVIAQSFEKQQLLFKDVYVCFVLCLCFKYECV